MSIYSFTNLTMNGQLIPASVPLTIFPSPPSKINLSLVSPSGVGLWHSSPIGSNPPPCFWFAIPKFLSEPKPKQVFLVHGQKCVILPGPSPSKWPNLFALEGPVLSGLSRAHIKPWQTRGSILIFSQFVFWKESPARILKFCILYIAKGLMMAPKSHCR